MDRETINVADLKLDSLNPRHEPIKSQRDIIEGLLNQEGNKLARLAEDIAMFGLSPIDVFLVLKESPSSYVVLEGNRRLAALKLLANPDLTKISKYVSRFRALKKKMATAIYEVPCVLVASREEGKHWQELRHTGEREGRGIVPWDTEASTRFHGRRGSHADKALVVADALQAMYPGNKAIQDNLKEVRKAKLTTFGRLVSDPYFRDRLGLDLGGSTLEGHYSKERIEPALEKVLDDLASSRTTVSDIKSKDQRRKYVIGLGTALPDESTRSSDAQPLWPAGQSKPTKAKPTKTAKATAPPTKPLFDGVQLTNLGGRISDILAELQRIDVDKFPNASAALLRVVVELAVTEVHVKKGWPVGASTKLRDMVKKCVRELDPTEKDPKFQPIRAGLNDGTSMFAVATIHGYLHNTHFNPVPSELRATASNYAAFLAGLDTLV